MQKHTTGKTCSIATGLPALPQKRKRPGLRLESWDASRAALPRSLLTTTLRYRRCCGNGTEVRISFQIDLLLLSGDKICRLWDFGKMAYRVSSC
jgi:hypothetical protein